MALPRNAQRQDNRTALQREVERQLRQNKVGDDRELQEQMKQMEYQNVWSGLKPAEPVPYVDETQKAYGFMPRLFEMQPLLPRIQDEKYWPRYEWDLRYGNKAPSPSDRPLTSVSQPLPPPTSGFAAGTSMPGDARSETPLARALRQFAEQPAGDSDRAAAPSANRAPDSFADPLATLAALIRLSAARDGTG
jgi:hypothetical protein